MIKDIQENYEAGWIKTYRSMQDHWLWIKPLSKFEAWLDILFAVNHSDEKVNLGNDIYTCKRGEKLYSAKTWAKRWGWNKGKVYRFIKLLEKDSMIELKMNSKTTHLIVCNYNSYQDKRNAFETHLKRKRNAFENNIRIKELKNDKNIYIHPLQKFIFENLKQVAKLGIPTGKEMDKLISKYTQDIIIDKLWAMENHKQLLKKYNSTYLTLNNWCKNGKDKEQSSGSVKARLDYRFNEDNAKKRLAEIKGMFR